MNRRSLLTDVADFSKRNFPFSICFCFFLLGCIIGILITHAVNSNSKLFDLIDDYLVVISPDDIYDRSLISNFLEIALPVLISFLIGFSLLGVPLIPLFSAVRGFSVSFSMAFLMGAAKSENAIFVIMITAVRVLITIPIFLMVSSNSLGASYRLLSLSVNCDTGNRGTAYNRKYFFSVAVLLFILFIFSIIEKYVLLHFFEAFL